jgi:hypothetical protein
LTGADILQFDVLNQNVKRNHDFIEMPGTAPESMKGKCPKTPLITVLFDNETLWKLKTPLLQKMSGEMF